MKMEQTECSETSAYKIQMPGNYPEESIQQTYILQTKAAWNKDKQNLKKQQWIEYNGPSMNIL
jgi:hypothetical protein